MKQDSIPNAVGIAIAKSVHFILPVSFFIVRRVVAHGQCIIENSIMFTAVIHVQPLLMSMGFN